MPWKGWMRVAWRETVRARRSRQTLLLTVVFPLASAAFLAWLFGASVPRALPVAVVDLDHSALSRRAVRMVGATPGLRVAFQEAGPDAGFARVRRGEAYALVLLPGNLERDVVRGRAPSVGVYVNNQLMLPGSLVARDLRTALGTLAAGVKVQVHRKTGAPLRQALERSEPVHLEAHALFNPELDYRSFLVPSLVAALLHLLTLLACIVALGREAKRRSVDRWFRAAGEDAAAALFGKLLPYGIVHALVSLALLLAWHGPMGNPHAGSLAAEWLALALMGWAAAAIAVFFVGWTSDYRLSLSLGAFFGGPAMAFAGVTFPAAAMNGPALGWASALPLSHAIRILVDQGLRGADLGADLPSFLALAALAALFLALSWRRWGALFRHRVEWRRS